MAGQTDSIQVCTMPCLSDGTQSNATMISHGSLEIKDATVIQVTEMPEASKVFKTMAEVVIAVLLSSGMLKLYALKLEGAGTQ